MRILKTRNNLSKILKKTEYVFAGNEMVIKLDKIGESLKQIID